ncbi:MAG: DUF1579 domain-containing protein [Tepidisphaeraceae bacterium]
MRELNRWMIGSLVVLALIASRAAAQDKDKMGGMPGGPSAAEMEAMMKAATPGPEHAQIAKQFVGTWDAEVKMVMGPGVEQTSKGTMVNEMILDGRYMTQKYEGEGMMPGQKMIGMGAMGYDNASKKYVGTWLDSMGTGIMYSTGTYDAAMKTYTMECDMCDPMTGKMCHMREVLTVVDDNHHTFEIYGPDPSGKEAKMMTINYSRRM